MSDRLEPADNLNLVPIMNLVTILIPFLLMAAQFVSLAVVDTTVPAVSSDPPASSKAPDALRLSLAITDAGFSVLGSGLPLGIDTGDGASVEVACPGACTSYEDYPHDALRDVLIDIKHAHPDHEEIVLVPEASVDYATLVQTMDTTREYSGGDLFPAVVIAGGARN